MISVGHDAVGQYFTHSRTSKPGVSRLRPRHCFITKICGTSRILCDHFNGPTASLPGAVSIPRNRFPCSSVEAAPRLLKPYHEGSGLPSPMSSGSTSQSGAAVPSASAAASSTGVLGPSRSSVSIGIHFFQLLLLFIF